MTKDDRPWIHTNNEPVFLFFSALLPFQNPGYEPTLPLARRPLFPLPLIASQPTNLEGKKKPDQRPGFRRRYRRAYIMPPMPPMSGIAGAGASSFGDSATITSVVIIRPATEPAA